MADTFETSSQSLGRLSEADYEVARGERDVRGSSRHAAGPSRF